MAVKTWSAIQSSVATSSGESEYFALIRVAAEALCLAASAMRDLCWELKVLVLVVSFGANTVLLLFDAHRGAFSMAPGARTTETP